MAYVYIIKNDINDKVYVGKTNFSIKKRFQEHLKDSNKQKTECRPLYRAMNKYGKEHFYVEELEQCSVDESGNREIYWINFYNSYHNGYNATLGGDGKTYINYTKVLKLFDETQKSQKQIALECNCSVDSVRNIVKLYRKNANWYLREDSPSRKTLIAQPVAVRCIETQQVFSSTVEAINWLIKEGKTKAKRGRTHISEVCKGKRKTAYGYHWEYVH